MRKCFIIWFFTLLSVALFAQWQPDTREKETIKNRIYKNLLFLSSDSLEGREAGTAGEIIARDYIASYFHKIGLQPFFPDNSYYKGFDFNSDYHDYKTDTDIEAGKTSYAIHQDFTVVSYTMNYSARLECVYVGNGLIIDERHINDYAGFSDDYLKDKIFLIDIAYPQQFDFVSDTSYYTTIQDAVFTAIEKEASAIILYSGSQNRFTFNRNVIFQNSRSSIPVIYAFGKLSELFKQKKETQLTVNIETKRKVSVGYNVAAFIDNNAATSIIIGAHYDHLGYGSPISRYVGPPEIHPGADDNASGVVMMFELAEFVLKQNLKNHNYIFVAFGAEEKGLLGSKAFLEDSLSGTSNIIAMINIDMVGRLDKEVRKLNVLCTGTSLKWDSLLSVSYNPEIELSKNQSGTGGSDHLSFYLKRIPVLFFITGLHKDYHTPGDVIEKINFDGMTDISVLLSNLLFHLNNVKDLPFIPVENTEGAVSRAPRGVSLGIIPDHAFGGKGLRIDDVTRGKSADNAGMKAGDIIISIDSYEVSDITTYMKALSNFKTGSTATITVIRNNAEEIFKITF